MKNHQLRVRLFGALFAGIVGIGAHAVAADVEAFDSVDDAFAAEAEDFAQTMDRNVDADRDADSFGHPGHGGHHPTPHRGRFVCVAQNLRGAAFYGRDRFEYQAQNEALQNCYRARSAKCFVTSCRREFH